jgi:hypothetical protein
VNGRTLISAKLGRLLTSRATLPLASHCRFDERSGIRGGIWAALGLTVVICLVLAIYLYLV